MTSRTPESIKHDSEEYGIPYEGLEFCHIMDIYLHCAFDLTKSSFTSKQSLIYSCQGILSKNGFDIQVDTLNLSHNICEKLVELKYMMLISRKHEELPQYYITLDGIEFICNGGFYGNQIRIRKNEIQTEQIQKEKLEQENRTNIIQQGVIDQQSKSNTINTSIAILSIISGIYYIFEILDKLPNKKCGYWSFAFVGLILYFTWLAFKRLYKTMKQEY